MNPKYLDIDLSIYKYRVDPRSISRYLEIARSRSIRVTPENGRSFFFFFFSPLNPICCYFLKAGNPNGIDDMFRAGISRDHMDMKGG